MKDLEIILCGTKYRHSKGMEFSKSAYPACYLLLFFETDFISSTKEGIKTGDAYSYILHPPYSKIYHTNTPDSQTGFTNDWIYLKGKYIDELVQRMNIPTNTIVLTYDSRTITGLIAQIQNELSNEFIYKKESIKALVTGLFIELARKDNKKNIEYDKDSYNTVSKVRNIMMENYRNKWTLNSVSKLSGFSPSYFLSLYKKYYSKSPIDDLIDYRILQAKFMLESNMLNISEISSECGFNTLYYFSRVFKQRTGMSPSQYQASLFQKGE